MICIFYRSTSTENQFKILNEFQLPKLKNKNTEKIVTTEKKTTNGRNISFVLPNETPKGN